MKTAALRLGIFSVAPFVLLAAAACGNAVKGSGFDTENQTARDAGRLPDGAPINGDKPPSFGDAASTVTHECVNLQCKQTVCAAGAKTTVTGQVLDPGGRNPLYNVVVYVPNSAPQKISDGATCDKCGSLYTGDPLVSALTGPDGKFVLENVPVGNDVPLVIQVGKWRRQLTIPTVASCVETPLTDTSLTRLPRNRREGDMPKLAISTGGSDSLECLLTRIGIDPAEFTSGDGPERVHIFQGNGGRAVAGGSPRSQTSLWNSTQSLMQFDVVALSCEGDENPETKPASALQAMLDYTSAGGRVFASHFHYYWFNNGPAPFPSTASWNPGSNNLGTISGAIDQTFPKGVAFAQWLKNVNALQLDNTLPIVDAKQNASVTSGQNAASQPWITNAASSSATEYFTFNTPLDVAPEAQCGRVVYSDLHVGAASSDYLLSTSVPTGCSALDLSPQEKALEFMLFDLSSCVQPDTTPPTPPPPPVR